MFPLPTSPQCAYEGEVVETVRTPGGAPADVRRCVLHVRCSRLFVRNTIRLCSRCGDYRQSDVLTEMPTDAADSNGQANDSKAPSVALAGRSPLPLSPHIRADVRPVRVSVSRTASGVSPPATARYRPITQTSVRPIELQTTARRTWDKQPVWAYGVTTVPERNPTPLRRTLISLKMAGFEYPTVFVDGDKNWTWWERELGLPVVCRYPRIRTYGNWILTLAELYIRKPNADFYAVFQDDLVCSKNLRQYLEAVPYPDKGYWNLYTFPQNHIRIQHRIGFSPATGWRGAGAVALVFDKRSVLIPLAHDHMVKRVRDPIRGHKYVDGGVVETMNLMGYTEYVHNPSLVQHVGLRSSSGNPRHPQSPSFRGEEFDLLTLLAAPPCADPVPEGK